jgi:hypothetical protein
MLREPTSGTSAATGQAAHNQHYARLDSVRITGIMGG